MINETFNLISIFVQLFTDVAASCVQCSQLLIISKETLTGWYKTLLLSVWGLDRPVGVYLAIKTSWLHIIPYICIVYMPLGQETDQVNKESLWSPQWRQHLCDIVLCEIYTNKFTLKFQKLCRVKALILEIWETNAPNKTTTFII